MEMNNISIDNNRKYLVGIVMGAVLGGLLLGYDIAVIFGAGEGLKAFFTEAEDFVYTDRMHVFTMATAFIGCVAGYFVAALAVGRYGNRHSLMIAAMLLLVSALGCMHPESPLSEEGAATYSLFVVFNIYRFIGGIGIGLVLAVSIRYNELFESRTIVSWNIVAVVVGIIVAYIVCTLIMGHHSYPVIESLGMGFNRVLPESDPWTIETGWRYMFVSEAVPAVLMMVLSRKIDLSK